MENQIYDQISSRTGGDIYIGVVGPVRTGSAHGMNCRSPAPDGQL